jgi:FkbH-like protein
LKLIEALEIVRRPIPPDGRRLRVFLACGFTPLHLQTFLTARLRESLPTASVEIQVGVFGDLLGNIERALAMEIDALVVAIEWADIDPRLGIRSLGGWTPTDVDDILDSADRRLASLEASLSAVSGRVPVACSLPTLPLPPLFAPSTDQSGPHELRLRATMASFASSLAALSGIRVVSGQHLDRASRASERLDLRSDLMAGFPYTLEHASAMGVTLADFVHRESPKKGLITDLDNTLWSGVVGDVGAENVAWDLDGHAQRHGLFQQMLAALAATGTLIGVASKNDAELVDNVFEREDLLLRKDQIFPIEVHWARKSESVARILAVWNVSPDAVVFVDDSPLELAEVKTAFPDIECLSLPSEDDRELWDFLLQLRDRFGKSHVSEEDTIRLESIRRAGEFRRSLETTGVISESEFLRQANGSLSIACGETDDPRAFELINKTNQFNLNGRRLSEAEWVQKLEDPSTFLVTASYEDKYGRLGKISALLARRTGQRLSIDTWVLSCRAFSRRIEHQCVAYLFDRFGVDELAFSYAATERNRPLTEFLCSMTGEALEPPVVLSRDGFLTRAPELVHTVSDVAADD